MRARKRDTRVKAVLFDLGETLAYTTEIPKSTREYLKPTESNAPHKKSLLHSKKLKNTSTFKN
ncbi:MAG: hypothetical protein U9O89_06020 [Thermoproteota archaeon]|nr:hypothetical protein [Thermoproteota archaeon]